MSAIDEMVSMADRGRSLEILENIDRDGGFESVLYKAGSFEDDDDQLIEALACIGAWEQVPFEDVQWLYAHALRRLRSLVYQPSEFSRLQSTLVYSLDQQLYTNNLHGAPALSMVQHCLLELDLSLLDVFGVGSRAIVGSVILAGTAGKLLGGLRRVGETRYGYEDIVKVFAQVGKLAVTQSLVMYLNAHLGSSMDEQGVRRLLDPAVVLCCPAILTSALGNHVEWCCPDAHYPFSMLLPRYDRDVLSRVGPETMRDLREEMGGFGL